MRYSVKLPSYGRTVVVTTWDGVVEQTRPHLSWAVGAPVTRVIAEIKQRGGSISIKGTGR